MIVCLSLINATVRIGQNNNNPPFTSDPIRTSLSMHWIFAILWSALSGIFYEQEPKHAKDYERIKGELGDYYRICAIIKDAMQSHHHLYYNQQLNIAPVDLLEGEVNSLHSNVSLAQAAFDILKPNVQLVGAVQTQLTSQINQATNYILAQNIQLDQYRQEIDNIDLNVSDGSTVPFVYTGFNLGSVATSQNAYNAAVPVAGSYYAAFSNDGSRIAWTDDAGSVARWTSASVNMTSSVNLSFSGTLTDATTRLVYDSANAQQFVFSQNGSSDAFYINNVVQACTSANINTAFGVGRCSGSTLAADARIWADSTNLTLDFGTANVKLLLSTHSQYLPMALGSASIALYNSSNASLDVYYLKSANVVASVAVPLLGNFAPVQLHLKNSAISAVFASPSDYYTMWSQDSQPIVTIAQYQKPNVTALYTGLSLLSVLYEAAPQTVTYAGSTFTYRPRQASYDPQTDTLAFLYIDIYGNWRICIYQLVSGWTGSVAPFAAALVVASSANQSHRLLFYNNSQAVKVSPVTLAGGARAFQVAIFDNLVPVSTATTKISIINITLIGR